MKSLTLLRHAKTEADSASGDDVDRELTDSGRQDADRVGSEIRDLGLEYDLVLASPARRAAQTVERVGGLTPNWDGRIYNAATEDLLGIVRSAPAEVDRLMVVGHNPGFERLASRLLGQHLEMPTGSLIEIELATDSWREIEEGSGRAVRFLKPKELA